MPSLTVENYLKTILQIELQSGQPSVSTGQIAAALDVSPGTVTSMQKTLADAGLANYRPYEGVTLTEAGRIIALRMVRRHRLIELFLVQTLDLSWDQVHEEAEHMEHAVSDVLVDRIDHFLGRPDFDPHGDPIPSADGELRGAEQETRPLSTCPAGALVRSARVLNQNPDFLRFLSDAGFEIGCGASILSNRPEAGIIELRINSQTVSIGHSAAEQLLVELVPVGAEQ
ncbi:metal-dependent transcriptional regulator [bacterium]|nr:metal-dependent transcriptional regulator [bacterium]